MSRTYKTCISFILFCNILLNFANPVFAETATQERAKFWQQSKKIQSSRPPGFIDPSGAVRSSPSVLSPLAANTAAYDEKRLIAGHFLRRIGFGVDEIELKAVQDMGIPAYLDLQLNPARINDTRATNKLPRPPRDFYADFEWLQRWYTRMTYTRRLLQEKMTLIWHEHFAVSNAKVGVGNFMHDYEDFLRKNALGDFRTLLIGITKDQAMLVFLDNNFNNGRAFDDNGKKIPPNENYAREFMQLFALGTDKLNMDGTPVRDSRGVPVPAYTEKDVKEVARALTGWYVRDRRTLKAKFDPQIHDSGPKTILGTRINGRGGASGAMEVNDVVNIIMKQPSTAPFISKMLIQKLATESPSPAYVERTARVFQQTGGNIRAVVRSILLDPEFYSPAVIRSQYKEPVEHFIGALRALKADTKGEAPIYWTYAAQQLVYYPPSVFSFYPPGNKGALVNTALVTIRDRAADDIVAGAYDTHFDTRQLVQNRALTAEQAADRIIDLLLTAPPDPSLRQKVIAYFKGTVDDEKLRGAVWLVLCSPDYQRN